MKKYLLAVSGAIFALMLCYSSGWAETQETQQKTVTPTGVIVNTTHVHGSGSDDLAVGDPYSRHAPSQAALAGHPSTQQNYGEDCKEERCTRAKNRQLSSPHWTPEPKSSTAN